MSRRTLRAALAAGIATVLVLDGGAAYQLGVRAHRAPSFSRGGRFGALPADHPLPYTPLVSASSTTTAPPPSSSTVPTSSTSSTAAPSHVVAAGTPSPSPVAPSIHAPAVGTYTYAVDGKESATGFGARQLPPTMTTTVAVDPDDAARRVLDLRFSDEHEEREIAAYGRGGIGFVYEAGSVTFGPYTQTSEADYAPPMLQVPARLTDGTVVKGTSDARSRVEDWTVQVLRTERVDGYDTVVVKIDRQSRPGTAEQVTRSRTYWYAPELGTWVRWEETMHASRAMAGTAFRYDCAYTATLEEIS
ncbi:MAG: hypothetical protein V7636_2917 [Actinomycetota bacterium]